MLQARPTKYSKEVCLFSTWYVFFPSSKSDYWYLVCPIAEGCSTAEPEGLRVPTADSNGFVVISVLRLTLAGLNLAFTALPPRLLSVIKRPQTLAILGSRQCRFVTRLCAARWRER